MSMRRIWPIDKATNVNTLPFVTRPALFGWASLLLWLLWLLVTRLLRLVLEEWRLLLLLLTSNGG